MIELFAELLVRDCNCVSIGIATSGAACADTTNFDLMEIDPDPSVATISRVGAVPEAQSGGVPERVRVALLRDNQLGAFDKAYVNISSEENVDLESVKLNGSETRATGGN